MAQSAKQKRQHQQAVGVSWETKYPVGTESRNSGPPLVKFRQEHLREHAGQTISESVDHELYCRYAEIYREYEPLIPALPNVWRRWASARRKEYNEEKQRLGIVVEK